MAHPRAADDFATIRARLEELRRECARAERDSNAEPYRAPLSKSAAGAAQEEIRMLRARRFSR
jgi:hypothetical protein